MSIVQSKVQSKKILVIIELQIIRVCQSDCSLYTGAQKKDERKKVSNFYFTIAPLENVFVC